MRSTHEFQVQNNKQKEEKKGTKDQVEKIEGDREGGKERQTDTERNNVLTLT